MADAQPSGLSAPLNELPGELYIGFVDGLLDDIVPIVLLSAITVTCGELAAGFAAKNLILVAAAPAQLLIAAIRLCFAWRHAKAVPSPTVEAARMRERIFSTGALASLTALSLWTLLAFAVTDNDFARFLGVSTTIAFAFSLMSRSYANYRGINLQLFGAFVPLAAAMIVAGGWYPVGIVVGIVPLVLYMKAYAKRLRANFMDVVAAQQKAETLAARLDTALNNMSHGLCMVDRAGRLTLANDKFYRIFNLPPETDLAGAPARTIFRTLVGNRSIGRASLRPLARAVFGRRSDDSDTVLPTETPDGRAIEITTHKMDGEGTVLVIQDVTERRDAQAKINRMARFDPVTELPNRRYFEEGLALALHRDVASGESLTVMFLDLDDFKQVNDSLGHRTGDKLLIELAGRLSAVIAPGDVVARWGGDEFVILHRHSPGGAETSYLARRIIDEVSRAVVIDGSEVIVGASMGSASAPDDGLNPDALLSKADLALYAAKAEGRGTWQAFEPEMDTKIQIRRLIELELRAAIATGGIEVHFQPIVSVATGRIVSFEALARWRSALLGPVPPVEFIPIVEEIGLMEEMGAAVLRRACKACSRWPEEVGVSVNLSSSQFRGGRLEQTILSALAAARLAPGRLDLEITESILLDDRGDTRRALEALRAHGLRISLDDFGTGYSSLSYLLSFPLDRIKIDRSFTIGLGVQERASVLIEGVAGMSRKLGMSVLIEGVETRRQLRMIETLGAITEAQGYLFSRPVPEAEVGRLLQRDFRVQAA